MVSNEQSEEWMVSSRVNCMVSIEFSCFVFLSDYDRQVIRSLTVDTFCHCQVDELFDILYHITIASLSGSRCSYALLVTQTSLHSILELG